MIALAANRQTAGSFTRRGACPALSAPMLTGDGLLVRLNPVAGGLSPQQLVGLCDAAEMHGNGVIEVTARGSIQLRGLSESSALQFADAVNQLDIPVRTGVPVQTGALAGFDPDEIADPTALAEMIRACIAKTEIETRLGPKVSVVVDGGGRTGLEEVTADVRLAADSGGRRPFWHVSIAGDARTARTLGIAEGDEAACAATLALLSEIADIGREGRGRDLNGRQVADALNSLEAWRSTLPPSGLPAISPSRGEITPSSRPSLISNVAVDGGPGKLPISPLEGEMAGRPEGDAKERDAARSLIGTVEIGDARLALGIALPFGHTSANLLKTFAEKARDLGVGDIRPAPRRTLVAVCATAVAAEVLRKLAEILPFVTSPDDPRQSISACPGAPECASGHIPARQMAAEIAKEYSGLLDGSMHLHVSGCAKGCAHPGKAELVLVGSESGVGLVFDGTARDEPLEFTDSAIGGLSRIAALVETERRAQESTAQTIQRLELPALAEAFGQGGK